MTILITGGCGFLGSNLAEEGLKRQHRITILDNLQRIGSQDNLTYLKQKGTFEFIHADVRDYDKVLNTIKNVQPDVIFHLAGQVAMTTSIQSPLDDFKINALGTLHILESCRIAAPHALIVYSSTNKVYGDLEYFKYTEQETRYSCPQLPLGMDEHLHLDCQSPYGCSKGAADAYLLDYHRVFGLKTVVFRHSSMYGGRQYATFDQGWIGWFCKAVLNLSQTPEKSGIIDIHGNGKQVRDLLFASDMVDLYFKTIDHQNNIAGQAFNIGGGMDNSMSLLELLTFLSQQLNTRIHIRHHPMRASDQKIFVADIRKAKKLLQWMPQVGKFEGLLKMLEWVKTIS